MPVIALVFLLCVFSWPSWGYELEPFAQSQLQHEGRSQQESYRLVISGLTRTQAVTKPLHELRVSGQLWRRTWAVDKAFGLKDVIAHFEKQLENLPIVYQCQALDCGSSQFWANEIFANARLVGREQFQFYQVALERGTDAQHHSIYVLYVMQRGTKQVMVNLDVFTTTEDIAKELNGAEQIRQQLKRNNGWLSGFVTSQNHLDIQASRDLIQVLNALSSQDKARLFLQVQCYNSNQMSKTLECSQQLAQELSQALTGQFNIQGQGALTMPPTKELTPALRFVFWPNK